MSARVAKSIRRLEMLDDLGHGVRVEFDLYWDIPKGRKPVAVRAFGGPSITDMKNLTGTDIKATQFMTDLYSAG